MMTDTSGFSGNGGTLPHPEHERKGPAGAAAPREPGHVPRPFRDAGFSDAEYRRLVACLHEHREANGWPGDRRDRGSEASTGGADATPEALPALDPRDWRPWLDLVRRGCADHRALAALPHTEAVAAVLERCPPTPQPAIRPGREARHDD